MADFVIMPLSPFLSKNFPVQTYYIHPTPKENYNFIGTLNIPKDILFLLPCKYKDKVWHNVSSSHREEVSTVRTIKFSKFPKKVKK